MYANEVETKEKEKITRDIKKIYYNIIISKYYTRSVKNTKTEGNIVLLHVASPEKLKLVHDKHYEWPKQETKENHLTLKDSVKVLI